jgi:hypothetical protein
MAALDFSALIPQPAAEPATPSRRRALDFSALAPTSEAPAPAAAEPRPLARPAQRDASVTEPVQPAFAPQFPGDTPDAQSAVQPVATAAPATNPDGVAATRALERGLLQTRAARRQIGAGIDAQVLGDIGKTEAELIAEEEARLGPASPIESIALARDAGRARFLAAQSADRDELAKRAAEGLATAGKLRERASAIPMSAGAEKFRDGELANAPDTVAARSRPSPKTRRAARRSSPKSGLKAPFR